MLLHTVCKSPWSHSALRDCLQVIGEGDALLLMEDGVYGALDTGVLAKELTQLMARNIRLYAIEPDLRARGLTAGLLNGIEAISYDKFVTLTTDCKATQSWY